MNPKPEPINSLTQEEIDKLLLGDYAVDEAPPEKVMEVRDDENSKVMEVRDRMDADSKVLEVRETLPGEGGDHLLTYWSIALVTMAEKFFDVEISVDRALEIYEYLDGYGSIDASVDEREEAYRESIREIRRESNVRIDSLSRLITRLYLDLWHMEQIAGALMEVCDSYSPEDLKAIASLITNTGMRGRQAISSHTETDHYPQTLIKHNHESPAT